MSGSKKAPASLGSARAESLRASETTERAVLAGDTGAGIGELSVAVAVGAIQDTVRRPLGVVVFKYRVMTNQSMLNVSLNSSCQPTIYIPRPKQLTR